jgi:putative hydrolase of the HAD superfamily
MKFFRRLTPFKAISFDLDDTLYSNFPIMMATDEKMVAYFDKTLSVHVEDTLDIQPTYDFRFWSPYKNKALSFNPHLVHDVAGLRIESYYLGLIDLGLGKSQARLMAEQALTHFETHRSDFEVPPQVHTLLANLAERWPLVAISNGNVNTNLIGINHYFTAVYHAGPSYKQKPFGDMFTQAFSDLAIEPHELLHVGDCGRSDILGGILAGCQTAWVSSYDVGKPLSILPNIELSDVAELQRLL